MISHLTHTAILVPSVDRVSKFFSEKGVYLNPPEIFKGEGTREIYVGDSKMHSSLLLLVEPHGEGPYKKALQKRGPGIHHIGLDVENLIEYCAWLGRFGWLLHTHSLRSVTTSKTAYLVRPGVSLMLEVHERTAQTKLPPLLSGIRLSDFRKNRAMIQATGIKNARIEQSNPKEVIFETLIGSFSLSEILTYAKPNRTTRSSRDGKKSARPARRK